MIQSSTMLACSSLGTAFKGAPSVSNDLLGEIFYMDYLCHFQNISPYTDIFQPKKKLGLERKMVET